MDDPIGPRRHLPRVLLFIVVFVALVALWGMARGTALERILIDTLTVRPAVSLINAIDSSAAAVASGIRILSPVGNLNIRNGCDGSEIMFLLFAAFLIAPISWRRRLSGLSVGMALVFSLNQLRITLLFFAIRSDYALFDLLHTTAAPLILIAITAIYFYGWIYYAAKD